MPGPYPLPTLAAIIGAGGITLPTFEDILQSYIAAYQQIYGSDIYLGTDAQDFQWLSVQAQITYDANQALAAAYFGYSPSFAQGGGLSSVVKINGIRRLVPSNSTVDVALVGQAGTTITNGVVGDVFQNLWNLPATVVIPVSGTVTVTATAQQAGAIAAAPGTVTRMQTMVPGWQSVTNPAAAQPGMPLESDATLRKRQTASTSLAAITPRMAVLGALLNLPGVVRAEVYDNDTDMTDADGIPPHSLSAVVQGGDATQIATAIMQKKNTGCGTYGTIVETVPDPANMPQTINFFDLALTNLYIVVVIVPLANYLDSTAPLITAAIAEFINEMAIGETVYNAWLYAPANLAGDAATAATGLSQAYLDQLSQTYVVQEILVGTAANPTSAADIGIVFNAAAACDPANVTVQVSTR